MNDHNVLTGEIIQASYKIHKDLGPGLFEIVELKSVEKVSPAHKKQLLTYLKLTGNRLGLLINFGEHMIKNGIHRIINGY